MSNRRTGRFDLFPNALLLLAAAAIGLQGSQTAYGQTASDPSSKELLPLKNAQFKGGGSDEQPVADWKFESLTLEPTSEQTVQKLRVRPKGDAIVTVPDDGKGVLLEGTTDTARGDLISSPIKLRPFHWVKVTVRYKVESGEPLALVCLRPTANRAHVDLECLAKPSPGKIRKASVMLHSGSSEEDYSISVSIVGTGTVRFLSIEAQEKGAYARPDKTVLIIDFLDMMPAKEGEPDRWEDAKKLVTVFGFPKVEYIHFTEFTVEKLKEMDPDLVIVSPGGENLQRLDRQKSIEAARVLLDNYDGPLLGICLGHQLLAMVIENEGLESRAEWGPTEHKIIKKDPIFKGLPRHPHFTASESHNRSVIKVPDGAEVIAKSSKVKAEVFRYTEKPWYTFQAHIEREWEFACPEAHLLWENMFREWGFRAPPPAKASSK